MSHIRDLQKLRKDRPTQIFAQTNYAYFTPNPESKGMTFEVLMKKNAFNSVHHSPQKKSKEPHQQQSATKIQFHKRGGSFGNPFHKEIEKPIHHEVPNARLSIYNFSMKVDTTKKLLFNQMVGQFPLTERKEHQKIKQSKSKLIHMSPNKIEGIHKKNFNILLSIGKGGFGKVWKVETKKNKFVFAMKEMSKAKVIQKKSVGSVMNERDFLAKLHHPFLVNMVYAFQDRQNLYLIMDYLDGGDLRYHLGNHHYFSERETKFFIANIIIGLEYLHRHNIIHRDIKPENLIFDSTGYLRITDLGISRQFRENNAEDTSGTPGYMSPQVMCRKQHNLTVDYFALGVIGYELMIGHRPYQGANRKQIKQSMLSKQAVIRIDELPYKWSPNSIDFINRLLLRNPDKRLGSKGIHEIKQHPWLHDVEWEKLITKKIKSPFKPISIEDDYQSYREQISEDSVVENAEENKLLLRDHTVQGLFDGYYYEKIAHEVDKHKKNTSFPTNSTEENIHRRK